MIDYAFTVAREERKHVTIVDKKWKGPLINFVAENTVNPSHKQHSSNASNLNSLVGNQHKGT
jgi:hypothetical protein